MTVHLQLEDVLQLVEDLRVGPVRDLGLLDSAVHRPMTSLWGREAYPELAMKAAVLAESIVRNHALVDGNKRLAWLAAVVLCAVNGVDIGADDDEAYELVVGMAAGEVDAERFARALRRWAAPQG